METVLLATQAGSSAAQAELPVALNALKDWSAWLVGIQAAVLGLAGLSIGKDGSLVAADAKAGRLFLRVAIVAFAGSIFCATWVLGAIPSIVLRLGRTPEDDNFYHMPISGAPAFEWFYERLPGLVQSLLQLWFFVAAEHWLFVIGMAFFVASVYVAAAGKASQEAATTSESARSG
jgi:hypothetical protein